MADFDIRIRVDSTGAVTGARQVEGALDRTGTAADRLRKTLTRAFAVLGGAAAIGNAVKAIRDFDAGLIGIGKTTGLAGDALENLGVRIEQIGREVPVATKSLLEIGQAAGQLGVQGAENIARFVETVGRLETASDLGGAEAATTLARLIEITGAGIENVDRLGSSIVQLGNNFAATEREIARAATRIGQTTALYGTTAAEVTALATAVRSLGLGGELAGTAIGRTFAEIDNAIRTGGEQLRFLAEITQTAEASLRGLFDSDATEVFTRFLTGLRGIAERGGDVRGALELFNITGTESAQVLGALATRTDLLRDALRQSADAWRENTALVEESNTAAQSLDSRFQFLGNANIRFFAEMQRFFWGLKKGTGAKRGAARKPRGHRALRRGRLMARPSPAARPSGRRPRPGRPISSRSNVSPGSRMQVVERPIAELVAYEGNPRRHPPDQIELLKRSIREFGWTVPVLVDAGGVVVAGHGRVEAARELGMAAVPTILLDHLTEDQVRAYRIMDNRAIEFAGWDAEMLSAELEALKDAAFDLDLTGFGLDDIDSMLDGGAGGEWPDLPTDGGELGNMTFVVSSRQRTIIEAVLRDARKAGLGEGAGDNENSNGNALEAVCQAWAQSNSA